jgi:hypothetical protein
MNGQRQIGPEQQEEFNRFYAFYNELERQESGRKLLWIIGGVTLVIIAAVCTWTYQHPIALHGHLTPFELIPGFKGLS